MWVVFIILLSKKTGIVKWYKIDKGFGFVTCEVNGFETSNVLLHFTQFEDGLDILRPGDVIDFLLDESINNLQAKSIRLIINKC